MGRAGKQGRQFSIGTEYKIYFPSYVVTDKMDLGGHVMSNKDKMDIYSQGLLTSLLF